MHQLTHPLISACVMPSPFPSVAFKPSLTPPYIKPSSLPSLASRPPSDPSRPGVQVPGRLRTPWQRRARRRSLRAAVPAWSQEALREAGRIRRRSEDRGVGAAQAKDRAVVGVIFIHAQAPLLLTRRALLSRLGVGRDPTKTRDSARTADCHMCEPCEGVYLPSADQFSPL
jgi:hypothetical protein